MHAPGDVREAFYDWAEGASSRYSPATWDDKTTEVDGEEYEVDWLLGRLWNCTDQVPSSVWNLIDQAPNSNQTVASMVRHIKAQYRNPK